MLLVLVFVVLTFKVNPFMFMYHTHLLFLNKSNWIYSGGKEIKSFSFAFSSHYFSTNGNEKSSEFLITVT